MSTTSAPYGYSYTWVLTVAVAGAQILFLPDPAVDYGGGIGLSRILGLGPALRLEHRIERGHHPLLADLIVPGGAERDRVGLDAREVVLGIVVGLDVLR